MSTHATKVPFLSCYETTVFLPVPSTIPKIIIPGVSERCLEGVWVTLGTIWKVPMTNQLIKIPMRVVSISWFLFSQWPKIGKKMLEFGVSVGCLDGVEKVSWGVWVTLDTVWEVLMPNQLIKFQ